MGGKKSSGDNSHSKGSSVAQNWSIVRYKKNKSLQRKKKGSKCDGLSKHGRLVPGRDKRKAPNKKKTKQV